ncbi:MAG: hypothetical protein AAGK05_19285, partial [Pseudomonadota bacterium]
ILSSSLVANHVLETGHRMAWDRVISLARESKQFKRRFKEAWFTRKFHSGNRVFQEVDKAWDPFIVRPT